MGISSIKSVSPAGRIALWKMTETWQELRDQIKLPLHELTPLEMLTRDNRKMEWLACRLLVQTLTLNPPVIRHDEKRKPYLPGFENHISLSHSGEYASLYIHDNQPVGIDIQYMKPSIEKGIDYFLNDFEQSWINSANNTLLHLLWSAKESAFKYAGDADLDLKKHLTISAFKINQNDLIEVLIQKAGKSEAIRLGYEVFENYVLTWTL